LTEEADLDRLADPNTFSFLDENLASVLASVAAIQTWNPVLFRVVTLLERLKCGHQIVSTGHTMGNDTLGDTCGHSTLDDSSHRVHGANHFGLILRRHMEFDLLEEIF
jgi:hypothetical protein